MKKVSGFIANHSKLLLIVFLALTAFCAVCSQKVDINYDMTKYLPDDSSMKQGMDIMNAEFDSGNDETPIRVMFYGLTDAEKDDMLSALEDIEYVDSVGYEKGNTDYDNNGYTKYVVTVGYAYATEEEASVERALQADFNHHDMVMVVDDSAAKSMQNNQAMQ